ncbi:MAG: hypothetical protein A2032_01450 [Chloroflexi bacterium RBG_19FT_COMBO_49_13]|nr:MAG: hypothetical protein A2032_01450 [Chloroflexi bacterium RBG_19FT_COMBO_49_13]
MYWILILIVLSTTASCTGQVATAELPAEMPSVTITRIPLTYTLVSPTDTDVAPMDTPVSPTETNTPSPLTPAMELPFTVVHILPAEGSLSMQLAAQVQKAYALGYTPVVEFDAPW